MVKFSDAIVTVLIFSGCILMGCKSDNPVGSKSDAQPQKVTTVSTKLAKPVNSNSVEIVRKETDSTLVNFKKTVPRATEKPRENPALKAAQKVTKPRKNKIRSSAKPKTESAAIDFNLIRYDFGTIVQGDTVDYKFKFTNSGHAPLEIDSTKVTCGCTQPSYPFIPIEVGEEGYIGVRYVSVGKEGEQEPLISVYTNASNEPIALMMSGIVITPEQDSIRRIKE